LSLTNGSSAQQISGPLLVPGSLSVGGIRIVRPVGPPTGSYTIDNLRVTAPLNNSTAAPAQ
jgi:hypothetical protein